MPFVARAVALAALLGPSAPLACTSPALLPDRPADISGIVTNIQTGDTPERPSAIRIETNPAETSGSPKMVLAVTRETRVLDGRTGGDPRSIEKDALRVGDRVEAWVTGPVMESYPSRATAEAIVLLGVPAP